MERADDRITLLERESAEEKLQRSEAAYEEQRASGKPEASEEIMIEEINIDGMCGVY